MTKIIKFTNIYGLEDIYPPEPAYKNIPNWYKELESYIGGEKVPGGNGTTTGTIKRCMPVFDAINTGYIIKTPVDVYVSQKEIEYKNKEYFEETGKDKLLTEEEIEQKGLSRTLPYYEWANFGMIQFHAVEQAPNHPNRNGHSQVYPKWINPWAITTPPGYSVAFVQPWHRESAFTILPGIVDTDTYTAPVNFPFVLNDVTWKGLIPAGTPIAQVIPFKRDEWQMELGKEKELIDTSKVTTKLRTRFFDSYKSQFRQPKEYR